ncbi:glycoside hydrolase family 16 protein [Corynebacterium felinum]|uniref:GH16 domain-containing protein n=1 Tax=Corynebacterium felinum TaxID=131318 RepID=A0ABU2BAE5_9CORY|nr:glycoside hydrolase family 16 protein [Corynebacterium felinum]MDF5819705.1 glycoside hydrolase family 16 protein [Corynebacterium felinum]MDR7355578.1 hypothetical protein [Corynebacterium felinum]WJY94928.1 Endo-1,3-1,4-beta-glycanase ExsH [Corynebacterium felinum]
MTFTRRQFLHTAALITAALGSSSLSSCQQHHTHTPRTPANTTKATTLIRQTFNGPRFPTGWQAYDNFARSDPRTRWHPKFVDINNNTLRLWGHWDGNRAITGGVSNWGQTHQYGQWDITMRATAHPVLSYHLLLWPASDKWPPEIDIAESFDPERRKTHSFIHYTENGHRTKQSASIDIDATTWHTWSVRWTPTDIHILCDNSAYAHYTGETIPHEPMWLAIQVETHASEGRHTSHRDQRPVVILEISDITYTPYQPQ